MNEQMSTSPETDLCINEDDCGSPVHLPTCPEHRSATPPERKAGDVGKAVAVLAAPMSMAETQDIRAAYERDKWAGEWNSLPTAVDRLLAQRADTLASLMAERERTAGARALREAAEARPEWQAEMYAEDERHFATGSMHGAGVDVCADVVETWLTARAAALAPEDGSPL